MQPLVLLTGMIAGMQCAEVRTRQQTEMICITDLVNKTLKASNIQSGRVVIYVPHTTAGITINENADPDVVHDLLAQINAMLPWRQPLYRHGEGNSAAHVKATLVGSSEIVLIERGVLVLGRWQGIFFCEFDGPRVRQVIIQM